MVLSQSVKEAVQYHEVDVSTFGFGSDFGFQVREMEGARYALLICSHALYGSSEDALEGARKRISKIRGLELLSTPEDS
ncbi:MAG TPA: hypothetical protein ENH99_02225 [Candidatus Pacearchaeota archaeon]|nr:hypothetical protein [Candidatus Pacearchaeota archaeon]